jgi:multiple sugar transport system ATP-binding protein
MARIEIEKVSKSFGAVHAVIDLDLQIPDGSFTALLGPSGCGKTTTMNMLAGLLRPSKGAIRFDGRRVNEVPPGRRNVGFVFQNYAIFTHMSAYDNIAFGLRINKVERATIDAEVHRVAGLLDIEELLPRRAGGLSVNDLQKVALGRSMITNPAIFLLDEPFSNLDAAFRAYMRAEMKKLQRDLRQTMIYVTHDQVEAMAMADRIAVMDLGRLQQYGTPDEVYNHPANRFVAHFVGSTTMNFLPADVASANGAVEVRVAVPDGRPLALPAAGELAARNEASLTLGIRPEHLRLADAGGEAAELRGIVTLLEPLGPRNVVHLQMGEHVVRAVVPPAVRPRIGEVVGVELEHERVHLFDDQTGTALR